MKFDQEFKEAISLLPAKEKDKLLLRLLKKDIILAKRLYFELVSDDTVEDQREAMEEGLTTRIDQFKDIARTPKQILLELRSISKGITEHVKVTKDKYGEASLNLLMLNEVLEKSQHAMIKSSAKFAYSLDIYLIARAFKVLILIKALHEDFHIEFEQGLEALKAHFENHLRLKRIAMDNRMDLDWFQHDAIPEDILQINRDIRAAGLLR